MTMNPEIKARLDSLHQVIREGDVIDGFLRTEAWTIIQRTLEAQSKVYKDEAFEAARSDDKSIKNFLGRQEGIEWVINLLQSSFINTRNAAMQEKKDLQEQAREEQELDAGVHDHVTSQTYPGERPGFMGG